MPRLKDLKADFDWKLVETTEEDLAGEERRVLLFMLWQMYLIRSFENLVLELKKEDLVHGPVHTSVGQEAVAAGAISGLRRDDLIGGTHRAHHQFLAKALTFHAAEDYDPLAHEFTPKMQEVVTRLLAEIMGLAPGCCGGRGGSMHLCYPEAGVFGTDAIVAGGIPIATGAAFAERYRKQDRVIVSFMGDGAVNQGSFHEALNLAGLWNLPIIYFIENNQYAVATHVREAAPLERLSLRASSYGMRARVVDGMDPVAVKLAVEEAARGLRAGSRPYLIEAITYRHFHHAGDSSGSAFGYRTKAEEDEWLERDPITSFSKRLKSSALLASEEDEKLKALVGKVTRVAHEYCLEKDAVSGKRAVRASLYPSAGTLTVGLHSSGHEFDGIGFVEEKDTKCERKMKYVEAIAAVTGRWLEKDSRVFVLGEEVAHFGGGAYRATAGLPDRFPGRLLNTPISEAGFTGLACGAAMAGLRPIVEIMYPDFALVAADQIFNQIGKLRHIYGGKVDMPLVMRTRIAIGCGYGGQHSMDPVGLFALFPGWRIVAPATPFDYIGLFNSATVSLDPVLVLEHHILYNETGLVPGNDLDYFVKMGKARKVTDGDDVTVLCYSSTVALARESAARLRGEGVGLEVIDLRSLDLHSIDYETIGQSVEKTGRIIIIEQAPASAGVGAHIASECQRRFLDFLDAPVGRLSGADVPNPVSRVLESAAVPNVEQAVDAIRSIARH